MARMPYVIGAALPLVASALGCAADDDRGAEAGRCVAAGPQATEEPAGPQTPAAGARRTCPVTGEELGSMGPPLPVTVRGRTVHVCCEGCVAALRQDPDRYLGRDDRPERHDEHATPDGTSHHH